MGVPPAEASMRRILSIGSSNKDPEVELLMKQTDLLLIFVSNGLWQGRMEEREKFIHVIERFVSATILEPGRVDIREAAYVFERYRLEYIPHFTEVRHLDRYLEAANNHDLSRFALYLAYDLERHAPSLPRLVSDPEFPLETERRVLFASLSSILQRLAPAEHGIKESIYWRDLHGYELSMNFISRFLQHPSREYWDMLLDVSTKIEDRYNRLCQETGVDVAYTYRPMRWLRSLSWGRDIERDRRIVPELVAMIDDAQIIDSAQRVGRCLDFAIRHHSFGSFSLTLNQLADLVNSDSHIDPEVTCRQLMTKGFRQLGVHRPVRVSRTVPTPLVDDGSFLTDLTDDRPPVPMENVDATTIRVTRLVEVVALQVPEIREVFDSIDDAASMPRIERILLSELDRENVRIERIAYDLAKFYGVRILALPTMRERYFSSLSEEQYEGFRRIISCMIHLERLVGDKYKAMAYIDLALEYPDKIPFISRGLQALTRLYKKFQATPITDARYRSVTQFLPTFLVFGTPEEPWRDLSHFPLRLIPVDPVPYRVHFAQFRDGLEWVIGHEYAFASPISLTNLIAPDLFRLDEPMSIVVELLGGPVHEFDEMSLALDRILREPHGGIIPFWFCKGLTTSDRISKFALTLPGRLFVATVKLGGLIAIEAPMQTQLLRIVPVFVKVLTAIANGQFPHSQAGSWHRIRDILDNPRPTDTVHIQECLDDIENSIPQPTPAI